MFINNSESRKNNKTEEVSQQIWLEENFKREIYDTSQNLPQCLTYRLELVVRFKFF